MNTALGYLAGSNATTGSNNTYIGANVAGAAGESNTMYLGDTTTLAKTVIGGVRGISTVANAVSVVIDSTVSLARSIHRAATRKTFRTWVTRAWVDEARPVTFRYSQPYADGGKPVTTA